MIGVEALRLLREKWHSPTELAEELYVILGLDTIPITTGVPIESTSKNGQPFANLTGYSSGDSVFSIRRGPGDVIDISIGDLINIVQDPNNPPQQQTPASVFMGTVVSGTGAVYKVRLNTGAVVTVTQQQIEPTEKIPAGTPAIVIKVGSNFVMQVPTWV